LYYYSPSLENNHFAEIVEFIKSKQLDVRSMDDVFKWWSQESIVGKFEHDLVLEVLQELGYTRKEIPN
ncbi:MAG TPA: hypothetical protein VN538_04060, partial [Clostridia bacterium]|nr:hypothetical protein [Clostridia bacterium]